MFYSAYHGSQHYGSLYYRQTETAAPRCSSYYGAQHFASQHYGSLFYNQCIGEAEPPVEAPAAYYSPGLGGALFPKRKEPKRPRVRIPERKRAEPEALPVAAVLVARPPAIYAPALLAPDDATSTALVMDGGIWREPAEERMVLVDGMWRRIVKRTSWQYELGGTWFNYE